MKECRVDGCSRAVRAKGLCSGHYQQERRGAEFTPVRPQRKAGSGSITKNGYVIRYIPGHPEANTFGAVLEHRMVMSDFLGRPLRPDETVHHKNGVKTDNRIENLELWSGLHPRGARVEDQVLWALEILKRYKDEVGRLKTT